MKPLDALGYFKHFEHKREGFSFSIFIGRELALKGIHKLDLVWAISSLSKLGVYKFQMLGKRAYSVVIHIQGMLSIVIVSFV